MDRTGRRRRLRRDPAARPRRPARRAAGGHAARRRPRLRARSSSPPTAGRCEPRAASPWPPTRRSRRAPLTPAIDTLLVVGGLGVDAAVRRPGVVARGRRPGPRGRDRVDVGVHRRVRARRRRAARRPPGHDPLGVVRSDSAERLPRRRGASPTTSTSTTATGGPPRASPPASISPSPSSRTTTAPRARPRGRRMARRVRAPPGRPGAVQRPAPRPSRPARRAIAALAALAARPPRRRPRRSRTSPRRVGDEPPQLRPGVPRRDGHDAGGLRRGAAGRGGPPPARDHRPHRRRRRRRPSASATPRRCTAPFRRRVGTTPDHYRQHFTQERLNHADRLRPLPRLHRPRLHRAVPGAVDRPRRRGRRCARPSPAPSATTTACCTSRVDTGFDDVPSPDILVVPGGPITATCGPPPPRRSSTGCARRTRPRRGRRRCAPAPCCSAPPGILEGLSATTHWLAYEELASYGAKPTEQRVVIEGKVATAAGVSAGIDLGAHARRPPVGRRDGPGASSSASSTTRSRPTTPASPSKAPAEIRDLVAAFIGG